MLNVVILHDSYILGTRNGGGKPLVQPTQGTTSLQVLLKKDPLNLGGRAAQSQ